MEYIEPKPVEQKPHAKRNKIILVSLISALVVGAIAVGYYFLIDKIFLDFNNIEIYDYSYKYDDNKNITGTIINSLKDDADVPSHLRIPRKLGGYPVVELGPNSCQYFQTIESVDLPDTIKVIGAEAFKECYNLSSFNAPADLEEIGTDAFYDTKWLNDQQDGLVMVGNFLYWYKGDIPEEEPTILIGKRDSSLLEEYPDAEVIDLSQFTHMSDGVFREKAGIIAVEYPETFDKVNNDTFSDCYNLEKVILPSSIHSIGDNAFSRCAIKEFPALDTITKIGDNAFSYNKFTGALIIPSSVKSIGANSFKANKKLVAVSVPDTIDSIPTSAFEDCIELESFVFPASEFVATSSHIKTIGARSFKNTKISSFHVPYNVNTIGDSAFEGCKLLESVRLYNNTTGTKFINRTVSSDGVYSDWQINDSFQGIVYIGDTVFHGAEELKEITLVDSEGNVSASNTVKIPDTVGTFGSRSIAGGSKMFTNTKITKLDLSQNPSEAIASSVTVLNYVAPSLAESADYLEEVTFGTSNKITSINSNAFKNCHALTSVVVPSSITSIADGAFDGCSKLGTGLVFEAGFQNTSFKQHVLRGTLIESIAVADTVRDIDDGAFEDCIKLKTVSFGDGSELTNIGNYAFKGCLELTSINLPSEYRKLGQSAFEGCAKLTELRISKNFTILPTSLCKGCSALTTLTLEAPSVVGLSLDSLKDCDSLTTIKVPSSLVEQYEASETWNSYTIVAIA